MYDCASRSWEEERSTLEAQIEALHREAKANAQGQRKAGQQAAGGSECGDSEADESPEAQLADIKRQLDEAKEKEVGSQLLQYFMGVHCHVVALIAAGCRTVLQLVVTQASAKLQLSLYSTAWLVVTTTHMPLATLPCVLTSDPATGGI